MQLLQSTPESPRTGQPELQFGFPCTYHALREPMPNSISSILARGCISEAMDAVAASREKWWEAEVHRITGEITLMERDAAKAEACFERALAVAREQHAKSWELRAAMSMARLWREQGKRDEARELLAPVYGWFTEGFDTLDLKQAKALLDELAQ